MADHEKVFVVITQSQGSDAAVIGVGRDFEDAKRIGELAMPIMGSIAWDQPFTDFVWYGAGTDLQIWEVRLW